MKETFGYTPQQVPDMKGLMGDSSDNIPGIAGVGEKTALKLISQYGTLDNVLSHSDEIKGKLGEKIRAGREVALLSRELGTIHRNAPLQLDFDACRWDQMAAGIPTLEKYELTSLARTVGNLMKNQTAPAEQGAQLETTAAARRASGKDGKGEPRHALMAVEPESSLPTPPPMGKEETLLTQQAIEAAAKALSESGAQVAALCQTDEEISLFAPQAGLWHMPLLRDLTGAGLYDDQIFAALASVMTGVPLIVHGSKALLHRLQSFGAPLPAVFRDTMLAAYLLHTAQKDYRLESSLAAEYAEPPQKPTAYDLYALSLRQDARLCARGMEKLLLEMEQPLARVLFDMETEGFLVDEIVLRDLGRSFSAEIEQCRQSVLELCGVGDFNLNSPVQLGEVLFEKLGLPAPQKKGKKGYSTSAEVLEGLAPYHPAVEPLLRYRKLSKLQSTYIEGLTKLRGRDGRIHTTFDQTATVTGRISSLEPNLQNIPIRTDEGREIRRAFVAGPGNVLLDADYSQIELRVLAHLSGDSAMCDAFIRGQDIHTRTAAEIHGIPMEDVTPDMRRAAKATNFGIVYGISAFGLARNAKLTRREADAFIRTYFDRYPGVRSFMDECVEQGRARGYAQTMFGRRRELFELASPNRNVRAFGERAAMNTPVQGAAADIIKLAMVRVEERLKQGGYQARLILQVHDELVVECAEAEREAVAALLKETMEHVVALKVPLVAEVSSGKNWENAH